MVQCQVDVDAADVRRAARREDELRNPAADDDNVVTVLAQQAYKLQ
jgi:hypothetical protein